LSGAGPASQGRCAGDAFRTPLATAGDASSLAPETLMSDSRKYLLGATATIVAARIAARAQVRPGGDLQKPVPEPSLKDEFLATYRELEEAFVALGEASPQKAYGDKPRKRENESLLGD
jgi:hypothetical protein